MRRAASQRGLPLTATQVYFPGEQHRRARHSDRGSLAVHRDNPPEHRMSTQTVMVPETAISHFQDHEIIIETGESDLPTL